MATFSITSAADNGAVREDRAERTDRGFSLIEMLIVVTVLGALAAVAMLSVRGLSDHSQESVCGTDARMLATAVEVYMGERSVDSIPGADTAQRMDALVDAGLLRTPSGNFVIEPDGRLTGIASCAATA